MQFDSLSKTSAGLKKLSFLEMERKNVLIWEYDNLKSKTTTK
jgi:hypothetical protein